ncbi:hypothetical protein ADL19_21585 [Streptomyces purpurogeneiscleroticus]|nr:hypothetical protein ADL19_21585 [Streptomyces purpurogeneiscleroticus]
MGFDRHIVRSMAAMVLAIIAYVAPSAVEAHGRHVHCGHLGRAAFEAPTAPPSAARLGAIAPARIAEVPVTFLAPPRLHAKAGRSTPSVRAVDAGRGCCPGACERRCCGTMVCGTFGIVAGSALPAMPVFRATASIPDDVAGRAGIGPEALRRPPRTLA